MQLHLQQRVSQLDNSSLSTYPLLLEMGDKIGKLKGLNNKTKKIWQ